MIWLKQRSTRMHSNPAIVFNRAGQLLQLNEETIRWTKYVLNGSNCLGELSIFFGNHLTTVARLETSNPPPAIAITRDARTHPIHYLYSDQEIENRVSADVSVAFGEDLVVHRAAGREIPLFVGTAPEPELAPGQRLPSRGYWEKIEALRPLQTEGDGIRSFVGVLLEATVADYSVVLIDEPEAFLHPPQARLLARMLVQKKSQHRQLFIATHSADVVSPENSPGVGGR
jgi:hypothetical protein